MKKIKKIKIKINGKFSTINDNLSLSGYLKNQLLSCISQIFIKERNLDKNL